MHDDEKAVYRIKHHNGGKTFLCLTMWKPIWLHWTTIPPVKKFCLRRHHDGKFSGEYLTELGLMQQGAINVTDTDAHGIGAIPPQFWTKL